MGKWCNRYYTPEKIWPFPSKRFAPGLPCLLVFRVSQLFPVAGVVQWARWGYCMQCSGAATSPPMCRRVQPPTSDPALLQDLGLSPPSPSEQPLPFPQHLLHSISLAGGKRLISYSSAQNFSVSAHDKTPQTSLQNSWEKENTNPNQYVPLRHQKRAM